MRRTAFRVTLALSLGIIAPCAAAAFEREAGDARPPAASDTASDADFARRQAERIDLGLRLYLFTPIIVALRKAAS